jgi:hypothetical protein
MPDCHRAIPISVINIFGEEDRLDRGREKRLPGSGERARTTDNQSTRRANVHTHTNVHIRLIPIIPKKYPIGVTAGAEALVDSQRRGA